MSSRIPAYLLEHIPPVILTEDDVEDIPESSPPPLLIDLEEDEHRRARVKDYMRGMLETNHNYQYIVKGKKYLDIPIANNQTTTIREVITTHDGRSYPIPEVIPDRWSGIRAEKVQMFRREYGEIRLIGYDKKDVIVIVAPGDERPAEELLSLSRVLTNQESEAVKAISELCCRICTEFVSNPTSCSKCKEIYCYNCFIYSLNNKIYCRGENVRNQCHVEADSREVDEIRKKADEYLKLRCEARCREGIQFTYTIGDIHNRLWGTQEIPKCNLRDCSLCHIPGHFAEQEQKKGFAHFMKLANEIMSTLKTSLNLTEVRSKSFIESLEWLIGYSSIDFVPFTCYESLRTFTGYVAARIEHETRVVTSRPLKEGLRINTDKLRTSVELLSKFGKELDSSNANIKSKDEQIKSLNDLLKAKTIEVEEIKKNSGVLKPVSRAKARKERATSSTPSTSRAGLPNNEAEIRKDISLAQLYENGRNILKDNEKLIADNKKLENRIKNYEKREKNISSSSKGKSKGKSVGVKEKDELKTLQEKYDKMKDDLKSKKSALATKEIEIEELKTHLEEMSTRTTNMVQNDNPHTSANPELLQEVQELRAANEFLDNANNALIAELEIVRTHYTETFKVKDEEINSLKERITCKINEINSVNEEKESLKQFLTSTSEQIITEFSYSAETVQYNDTIKQRIYDAIRALQTNLHNSQYDYKNLADRHKLLDEKLTTYSKMNTVKTTDIATLKTQNEKLQIEVNQHQGVKECQEKEIKKFETVEKTLKTEVSKLESEIEKLIKEKESLMQGLTAEIRREKNQTQIWKNVYEKAVPEGRLRKITTHPISVPRVVEGTKTHLFVRHYKFPEMFKIEEDIKIATKRSYEQIKADAIQHFKTGIYADLFDKEENLDLIELKVKRRNASKDTNDNYIGNTGPATILNLVPADQILDDKPTTLTLLNMDSTNEYDGIPFVSKTEPKEPFRGKTTKKTHRGSRLNKKPYFPKS